MKRKFFIDCEFHEYAKQPKVLGIPIGKPINTVELISIALVNEDGEYYYAESNEFDRKAAMNNKFLAKSVLPHLKGKSYSKSNEKICEGILSFIGDTEDVELIGYWSAYDWVVLCQLFGTMSSTMPKLGFWYYTDLKQLLKDTVGWDKKDLLRIVPMLGTMHSALDDAQWLRKAYMATSEKFNNSVVTNLATTAHDSMCSLIPHVILRCKQDEDENYIIPKERAEKWLKRSKTPFNHLTPDEIRTPNNEAQKYWDVLKNYFQAFNN